MNVEREVVEFLLSCCDPATPMMHGSIYIHPNVISEYLGGGIFWHLVLVYYGPFFTIFLNIFSSSFQMCNIPLGRVNL